MNAANAIIDKPTPIENKIIVRITSDTVIQSNSLIVISSLAKSSRWKWMELNHRPTMVFKPQRVLTGLNYTSTASIPTPMPMAKLTKRR